MPQVAAPTYWIDANVLASQWLNALGFPNTDSNRKALSAWFLSESKRSGNKVLVTGNNPLNITTGSNGNYRLVGSHRIAVYGSQTEGVAAFGSLIRINAYNYPGILAALRAGNDAQTTINAIINSGWVTGGTGPSYWHTVNGQRSNLLQSVFNSLTGTFVRPPDGGSTGNGGGGTPSTTPQTLTMDAWIKMLTDAGISVDPSHQYTQAEATQISKLLAKYTDAAGAANLIPNLVGKTVYSAFPTAARLYGDFASSGGSAQPVSGAPLDVPGAIGAGVAALLATIVPVMALLGGGIMAMFGVYLITKEATSTTGAGESLVSPVPVFLRERV